MRTIIYVDGYNFYYNLVAGTKHKWLDLGKFFKEILPDQCEIEQIKYFTAKMDDTVRESRQKKYFKALRQMEYNFEPIFGYFKHDKKYFIKNEKGKMIEVKQLYFMAENEKPIPKYPYKERQTDVNLATHMIHDAWRSKYDCAVVVSNDSDIASSIKLAREYQRFAKKEIVCLPPIKKIKKNNVSTHLKDFTNFVNISHNLPIGISNILLKKCQLPKKIPRTNIQKPKQW